MEHCLIKCSTVLPIWRKGCWQLGAHASFRHYLFLIWLWARLAILVVLGLTKSFTRVFNVSFGLSGSGEIRWLTLLWIRLQSINLRISSLLSNVFRIFGFLATARWSLLIEAACFPAHHSCFCDMCVLFLVPFCCLLLLFGFDSLFVLFMVSYSEPLF